MCRSLRARRGAAMNVEHRRAAVQTPELSRSDLACRAFVAPSVRTPALIFTRLVPDGKASSGDATVDLEPIDRLEEKVKVCSSASSTQLRADQARATEENRGSTRELDNAARASGRRERGRPAAELSALRDERDLIRVARRARCSSSSKRSGTH